VVFQEAIFENWFHGISEEIPYQIPTAPRDCCIFTYNEWLKLMVNVGFIFQSRGASGNEFLLKIILTHHALRHLNVKLATIITCSVFFVQFSSLKS